MKKAIQLIRNVYRINNTD